MPTRMSTEEKEAALPRAKKVDEFAFRNPDDEDDYIVASLYKQGKKHFRVIESTGMNNDIYVGAGDIGEWLTAAEAKEWTDFR